MCEKHNGKEIINIKLKLSVDYIFECLFCHSEFNKKYLDSRKFSDIKVSEWMIVDSKETRNMEYSLNVLGNKINNKDEQVDILF